MARRKEVLDYHEGLSTNQVKIILGECGLNFSEFSKWMCGQTCPTVPRYDRKGGTTISCGVFEYDLFRWISHKKRGATLLWD